MRLKQKNKTANEETQERRRPVSNVSGSTVFSYSGSNSKENTERLSSSSIREKPNNHQDKKGHLRTVKSIPSIIAVLLILVALAYATMLSSNNPQVIQLSQSNEYLLRSDNEYERGIAQISGGSILSKSKLTADSKKMEKAIQQKYPEIGKVSVNFPIIGRRPIIQISPAEPKAIVTGQTSSFVVDQQGKAIMNATELPQATKENLPLITDSIDIGSKVGDYVLPENTIEFLDTVKYQLEQKDLNIDRVELPAIANELHIRIKGQSFVVKYNLSNDARQQVGSYLATLDKLTKEGKILPREYIDLRVDGRAYYK